MQESFSVAIISYNEEKTLPNLLDCLRKYQQITDTVVVDTGSTDNTVKIAKKYGCTVEAVSDRFKIQPTKEQFQNFINKFGFEPTFNVNEKYFHFSNARNYANSLTKNDWVFNPDCDEKPEFDIEKLLKILPNEDHLSYRFCYEHNPDGSCLIEIGQTKFFRKSKFHWVGMVHECEQLLPNATAKEVFYAPFIYNNHYQNTETNRKGYLPALEMSILDEKLLDRNMYYLARQYYFNEEYGKALKVFDMALEIMTWNAERGQALIYMGLCYKLIDDRRLAAINFWKAIIEYEMRREPWYEMGRLLEEDNHLEEALVYYHAALGVTFREHGYLNSKRLYGDLIPKKIKEIKKLLKEKA